MEKSLLKSVTVVAFALVLMFACKKKKTEETTPDNKTTSTSGSPTVNITYPTQNQSLMGSQDPSTIGFAASAADANGSIEEVEFYLNGVSVGAGENSDASTFGLSTSITSGNHTLYAIATDNQGNTTQSATISFSYMKFTEGPK